MATHATNPAHHSTVSPYLILKGAIGFFDFVQKVFGAAELSKVMRDEKTLMHGEVMIGNSIIMFAESTDVYHPQISGLFVYVDDADETYKKAIDTGATIVTELADQSYGRSGGVIDPFGNTWWITSIIK